MSLGLGQLFGGLLLGQMAGGGLLGNKQEEEQPTQMANNSIGGAFQGISNSMFKGMSQEDVYRMGLGFNTLRLEPDANLANSVESRINSINATKKAEADAKALQGKINQTIEYLKGKERPDLIAMVRGKIITPAKAFEMSQDVKGTETMRDHEYAMKIIEDKGGIENVSDVERALLKIPVNEETKSDTEKRLILLASPPPGGWSEEQLSIIGVPQDNLASFQVEQEALRNFRDENPTYYTRDSNGDGVPDHSFENDMRAIIVGGTGGVNVDVTIEDEEQDAWVTAAVEPQLKRFTTIHENAPKLIQQIRKIHDMQDILDKADEGEIRTGVFEPLYTQASRMLSALGLGDGQQAINTELLQASMGGDVFPLISALGIGARGLDTVEERKFLQASFTGSLDFQIETLQKITQNRLDKLMEALNTYNERVSTLGEDGYSIYYGKYEKHVLDQNMQTYDAPIRAKVKKKNDDANLNRIMNDY